MRGLVWSGILLTILLVTVAAGPARAADLDGDGYDGLVDDCNDGDPAIHPGATEIPGDAVDQDCDGNELCFTDSDLDTYGTFPTLSSPDLSCRTPGIADNLSDCDDGNSSIHPGATEVVADSIDEDCDGHELCYSDVDNDGYGSSSTVVSTDLDCLDAFESTNSSDCDDGNPTVHPGAVEVCDPDNVDEDCDGLADDLDPDGAIGKTSWYADVDVDGYGAGAPSLRCDGGSGFSSASGDDCDDGDASIHPGATEVVADGIDEDCDGHELCYADLDNDGYGSSSTVVSTDLDCLDASESTNSSDCDDGNPTAHPGAVEVCDPDNVDEDCDGLADDLDPEGAVGTTNLYPDADLDGYGAGALSLRCHGAAAAGDCDDGDPAVHPDAAEICTDEIDNDCNLAVDCADASCAADAGCIVVFDHLECFKVKTREKMKGTVDLDPGTNLPFSLAAGCTIKKAAKYCVPVTKTVSALTTTLTPDPAYVGQELMDDRICYKVKCPDPGPTGIDVHDQFGTRHFEKLKVTEVCTPAEQVPSP